MLKKDPQAGKPEPRERALQRLLQAIASREQTTAARLLAASPELARAALDVGATRAAAKPYFFDEIDHYAYAGDTALHLAAAAYQRIIAGKLLALGANVSARNRRGAEPLHYASDGSPASAWWDPEAQSALVELLTSAGADPNAVDKTGVAPLHRAVRTRSTGAVRALLAHGADVRKRNKAGSTPLHLAVQDTGRGGTGSAQARAEQATIIALLLDHGARPSDQDSTGRSVAASVKAGWIQALLGNV